MDHLRQLLKSLTKREKFYFKKTYSSINKKNSLSLYDLLSKNPQMDIDQLKNHFAGSNIGRNIHYEINQLYKKILRVLNIYRMNSPSPNLSILQTLQYAEILIEKKQLNQAKKLVTKAKKKAYKFEKFSILMQIIEMEEELKFTEIDADIVKNIHQLEAERTSAALKIKQYNQLKLLKNQFIDFQFSKGLFTKSPEKYSQLFKHHLLHDRGAIKSKKSLDLWFFSKSMVFSLLGQYEKAKIIRDERLNLLKDNKELFSDTDELIALNNYLFLMIQMKDQTNFKIKYDLLLSFSKSKNVSENTVLFFSYYLQLALFITLKKEEEIKKLFPVVFDFLTKNIQTLNTTQVHYLFFYLVKAMVAIHDYENSLRVLNIWNQHRMEGIRFIRFKILWLITHYSLSHFRLLQNELNNVKRSIREKKINNDNLNIFIGFLDKAIKNIDNQVQCLQDLERTIQEYTNYLPDYYVRVHEIDIGLWAQDYKTKYLPTLF